MKGSLDQTTSTGPANGKGSFMRHDSAGLLSSAEFRIRHELNECSRALLDLEQETSAAELRTAATIVGYLRQGAIVDRCLGLMRPLKVDLKAVLRNELQRVSVASAGHDDLAGSPQVLFEVGDNRSSSTIEAVEGGISSRGIKTARYVTVVRRRTLFLDGPRALRVLCSESLARSPAQKEVANLIRTVLSERLSQPSWSSHAWRTVKLSLQLHWAGQALARRICEEKAMPHVFLTSPWNPYWQGFIAEYSEHLGVTCVLGHGGLGVPSGVTGLFPRTKIWFGWSAKQMEGVEFGGTKFVAIGSGEIRASLDARARSQASWTDGPVVFALGGSSAKTSIRAQLELVDTYSAAAVRSRRRCLLALHPSDRYKGVLRSYAEATGLGVSQRSANALLDEASLIVAVGSSVLVEAAYMGVPIIQYVPVTLDGITPQPTELSDARVSSVEGLFDLIRGGYEGPSSAYQGWAGEMLGQSAFPAQSVIDILLREL